MTMSDRKLLTYQSYSLVPSLKIWLYSTGVVSNSVSASFGRKAAEDI